MVRELISTDNKNPISYLSKADKRLAKVIDRIGILDFCSKTYEEHNTFFFLAKEIVGQMISSKVKKVILQRFSLLCENEITAEKVSLLKIEQLREIGLSRAKSSYIINLAQLCSDHSIDFKKLEHLPNEEIIKTLMTIKGIGIWTSKMYLIFFLNREDVLPYEDVAFLKGYMWLYNTKKTEPDSIRRKCKKWKPYTSIGARYLYKALDTGLTKIPIKEFLNS